MSKACRQGGMDRTSFYDWKRRFEGHGLDGLKDLPPVHKSHPQTTPPEVQERIVELALATPARGCNSLANLLAAEGIAVSFVTVQNILTKRGLGTRYERLLELEKRAIQNQTPLSPEQIQLLERANPVFAERHVESKKPGELLGQDNVYVGQFKGIGKVYLHTVVDAFGSLAFGVLGTSKQPEWGVAVLYNDVLPFYQEQGLSVDAVLTDNGREFCGRELHPPFELFLALAEIQHRTTKVRSPKTNGFVERFHRTVKEEFFQVPLRTTLYETVEALQTDFDEWLRFYNEERPHLGYRNMGRKPMETLHKYKAENDPNSPTQIVRQDA